MRFLLSIAAAALLAACAQIADERIGRGPIDLHPETQAAFERYLDMADPRAFAVDANGWAWGAAMCEYEGCMTFDEQGTALKYCSKNAKGTPCYIYAIGRDVVWRRD